MKRRAVIRGTGLEVGARRVTNEELSLLVGSSDEWIQRRSGIKTRYFVEEGQSNAEMGRAAALQALERANLQPADLDALIFATLTPDIAFPGTGVLLQDALGVAPIPALDIRNQCSGFLYGLSVADAWIRAGIYERVLLVGSEIHSTGLDLSHKGRDVAVLFGDGAGAVVLEAVDESADKKKNHAASGRIVDLTLGADGAGADLLMCERPGSKFHPRIDRSDIAAGRHFPIMQGKQVFRFAVEILTREVQAAVDRAGAHLSEVVLVPHQSNRRINELVAQRVGISPERVVHTIEDYGNTTAASIPMALHRGILDGVITEGDLVVMAAFGSGLSWGSAVARW